MIIYRFSIGMLIDLKFMSWAIKNTLVPSFLIYGHPKF